MCCNNSNEQDHIQKLISNEMKQNGKNDSANKSKIDKIQTSLRRESVGNGMEIPSLVPVQYLSTAAPEIVLGSNATLYSTSFAAASACAYLVSGRHPIKVSQFLLCVNKP
jgi:hypothetical protein